MVAASYRRGRAQQRGLDANIEIPPTWNLPASPLVARKDRASRTLCFGVFGVTHAALLVKRAGRALLSGVSTFVGRALRKMSKHQQPGRRSQPAMPRSRAATVAVTARHARLKRLKKRTFKRKKRGALKRSPASARRSAKLKHERSLLHIRLADIVYDDWSYSKRIHHSVLRRVVRMMGSRSSRMLRAWSADYEQEALIVIECAMAYNATTPLLMVAFRALFEIVDFNVAEEPLRVVNACLRVLALHDDPDKYRQLWHHLVHCLKIATEGEMNGARSPAIAPILAHSCNPLGRLLDELARCDPSDQSHLHSMSSAVGVILSLGSQEERVTMIGRHLAQIKRAFRCMSPWDLCEVVDYEEYASIMMHDALLLKAIVGELLGPKRPEQLVELSNVAVMLMGYAVDANDNDRLEHMLGLGFMKSAGLLVAEISTFWGAHERIFTDILARHPEWKHYFKTVTEHGDPSRAITTVGRRIPIRSKVQPTQYVLEEPEEQEEPSQPTVPSRHSTVPKREETAAEQQQDASDEDAVATFTDLPPHFLVQLARSMTFAQMRLFRLSCKHALDAVDQYGRSVRALDIARFARSLWPEKHARGATIDTLYAVQDEMVRLTGWLRLDLISSINFGGLGTMNGSQLEAAFGILPRGNIKALNLVGVVVMPNVWLTLARLFPGVRNVRCTEHCSQFPASIKQEAMLMDGEKIGGADLMDRKELGKQGLLGDERLTTLRCLKALFPAACYLYVE